MLIAILPLVAVAPGCKVVKNADRDAKRAAAVAEADVVTATVNRTWDARVTPHIQETAIPLAKLAPAIAADLAAAGAAHGYRQKSEGAPWNFAVTLSGVITEANTKSKAAKASVDIDGDGMADAVLQLGPVIRGTALRDVLPFISFSDFRDQIEFAKLARAYNARAYEDALKDLSRDALVGARVDATGAFTLRDAGGQILITPVRIAISP